MYFLKSLLIFSAAVILSGCGGKKTETTEMKPDETKPKTNGQTTASTQKSDSIKVKTDTTMHTETKGETNKVLLETSLGDITIELYEKDAPLHTANFKKLVKSNFYEGVTFHRVIKGFMIQGGDPNSKDNDRSNDGLGGPGYTIPAEIKQKHSKGSLAGARLGDQVNPKRESSGSQFYIVTGEASHLDGQYTVFGKVIKGLDVIEKIEKVKTDERDNPVEKVAIKKVRFVE